MRISPYIYISLKIKYRNIFFAVIGNYYIVYTKHLIVIKYMSSLQKG